MTRVQTSELKTNRIDGDAEALRWSLSWLPDGGSESFTREAILAYAPATSGVYGLFNFDCQVFIGETANIQAALLRHQQETNFQSQHLQPTGFTFEPCAPELRRVKAEALIAKFHPLLQTEAALNEISAGSYSPKVNVGLGVEELENTAEHQEFPAHDDKKQPPIRPLFRFIGRRGAAFVLILVATAILIFFPRMPADYAIQKQANGANRAPARNDTAAKTQNTSPIETAARLANQSAAPMPPKLVPSSPSSPKDAAAQARVKPTRTTPFASSKEDAGSSKKWSVQISAAPVKDTADAMVQRLIANGYDGYVVQAEVKGQTYYRVRVGRFDKREEAESIRQSLAQHEDYRDAFLTGD